MPILVECHACGKTLRAPDHAAGKSSFCPGCGANVEIPAESASVSESAWETGNAAPANQQRAEEPAYQYTPPGAGPASGSRFQECPSCGHEISRSAVACPNCGERFASRQRNQGVSAQDQTLGMLCHLLAFSMFVGIPLGNILAPLALWMIKKDESEYVDHHGRESLNFQLSLLILLVVGAVGVTILAFIFGIVGDWLAMLPVVLGSLAGAVAFVGGLINVAIAAIHANSGEYYEYPYSLQLIPRSRPR